MRGGGGETPEISLPGRRDLDYLPLHKGEEDWCFTTVKVLSEGGREGSASEGKEMNGCRDHQKKKSRQLFGKAYADIKFPFLRSLKKKKKLRKGRKGISEMSLCKKRMAFVRKTQKN